MKHEPHLNPCRGTVLLLAMILVSMAGIVAYGFAFSMRQAGTAAQGLVVSELADTAARMGARHAYEVALADFVADPTGVTSPVGRHFTEFADHDLFNPAWTSPNPNWAEANSGYELDEDDIRSEAKLYQLYMGTGLGAGDVTYSNLAPPNDDRTTSMLATGMGRYIEPGYYNKDGTANPVRFNTVPGVSPDYHAATWLDEKFKPVSTRAKARYRLRYAVNAMDMGGHLLYGRQRAFDATGVTGTPTEWDGDRAIEYNRSFYNMLSGQGMNDSGGNPPRPQMMTLFLGLGTTVASHQYWDRHPPGYFLAGFTAAGAPIPFQDIPGVISAPVPMAGNLTSGATGGPVSWRHANEVMSGVGNAGGWALNWVYSPYGRATEYTPNPTRYYQGKTNCPWRINILTAPAQVVRTMLYAYFPPEITKPVARNRKRYSWVGYTTPAWPGLASPQWSTNPIEDVALNPTQPGGAFGPGVHLHADEFSPSYLGGVRPFSGFSTVDYGLPVTATTFAGSYPAPAAYWEDYAAFPSLISRDTDDRAILRTGMLGADIDIFERHQDPYGALSGRYTWTIAPGTRPAFGGSAFLYSADATPREPVRGMGGTILATYQWYSDQNNIGGDRTVWDLDSGQGFYHRDSYWLDIAAAMAGVTVLAKSMYFDAASCGSVYTRTASDTPPAKPISIRDVDRLFLAILGEYFPGDELHGGFVPGGSDTPKPGHVAARQGGGSNPSMVIVDNTCTANIRKVKTIMAGAPAQPAQGTTPAVPAVPAQVNYAEKCANMERVLNDWRMSFFGANPAYGDFRPFDFDGDGKAVASCYTGTVTVGALTLPGAPATAGVGPAPDYYWSLTGYFVMERGRYWRVLTRGEVFDERLKKPIAESNYEAVFAIDPDGDFTGTAGSLGDNCTLYQRWNFDVYRGFQPLSQ